jgi:hypothetical protein
MNTNKNTKIGIIARFWTIIKLGIITNANRLFQRIHKPPTALEITTEDFPPYETSDMCRAHQRRVEFKQALALQYYFGERMRPK